MLLLEFCAELIGYWPFDGNAEAVVGEDGLEVNGPIAVSTDRNGAVGSALKFNGIDQYIEVPGGGGLNAAFGGTIGLWANWLSIDQDEGYGGSCGAILSRQSNRLFSNNVLALTDFDPEFGMISWRQNMAGVVDAMSVDVPGADTWHHIAVTFSGDGSELFLDGVSQGVGTGTAPLHDDPNIPFSIGAWTGDGDSYAAAALDDIAIFDHILSADQIARLGRPDRHAADRRGSDFRVAPRRSGRTNERPKKTPRQRSNQ